MDNSTLASEVRERHGRAAMTVGIAALGKRVPTLRLQRDYFRVHLAVAHNEAADSHRKLESTRTGASGIEIEHTIANLLLGHVTVPIYHNCKSGRLGLQIKPGEIVQDVN